MPLYTSNSRARAPAGNWGRSWLLALTIFGSIFWSVESVWRDRGLTPGVIDSPNLWAVQRNRLQKSSSRQTIAVLGASRVQVGFSLDTFNSLHPNIDVVNLSVNGACPLATLNDIATNTEFSGIVLIAITALCFEIKHHDDQAHMVRNYLQSWRLNAKLDTAIAMWFQIRLVSIQPYISLKRIARELLINKRLPGHYYVKTLPSRFRLADYELMDNLENVRMERLREADSSANELLPTEIWLAQALVAETWTSQIQARGGKVIFVRMPYVIEAYPRTEYWDQLVVRSKATFLHFQDIPGMSDIPLPDGSHIDFRYSPVFTTLLVRKLEALELLTPHVDDGMSES